MEWKTHIKELERTAYWSDPEKTHRIALYGAGHLGELGLTCLLHAGIRPEYVVDRDKRGALIGIPIYGPEEVTPEDKKEVLFLITISSVSYRSIVMELKNKGYLHLMQFYTYGSLFFPDILNNGWILKDNSFITTKVKEVCNLLVHDEVSLAHYLSFLYWKRFNEEVVFFPIESGKKYFNSSCMPKLSENEVFMDVGCYRGANIGKFLDKINGKYKKIVAIEPLEKELAMAQKTYCGENRVFINTAISCFCGEKGFIDYLGMASHLDDRAENTTHIQTIDSLMENPTIIKIHIEGEELNALRGSIQTIKKNRPIMMVLGDHNEDGWYAIPMFVRDLEEYRLYFRLHDYCGNSAVWYFIPRERIHNVCN